MVVCFKQNNEIKRNWAHKIVILQESSTHESIWISKFEWDFSYQIFMCVHLAGAKTLDKFNLRFTGTNTITLTDRVKYTN